MSKFHQADQIVESTRQSIRDREGSAVVEAGDEKPGWEVKIEKKKKKVSEKG